MTSKTKKREKRYATGSTLSIIMMIASTNIPKISIIIIACKKKIGLHDVSLRRKDILYNIHSSSSSSPFIINLFSSKYTPLAPACYSLIEERKNKHLILFSSQRKSVVYVKGRESMCVCQSVNQSDRQTTCDLISSFCSFALYFSESLAL